MTHPRIKSVIAVSAAALPLLLDCAEAVALEPIELLGKHIFFDEKLSTPSNKQACASCHDPARGWILPDSEINRTTVVAPGAMAPSAFPDAKRCQARRQDPSSHRGGVRPLARSVPSADRNDSLRHRCSVRQTKIAPDRLGGEGGKRYPPIGKRPPGISTPRASKPVTAANPPAVRAGPGDCGHRGNHLIKIVPIQRAIVTIREPVRVSPGDKIEAFEARFRRADPHYPLQGGVLRQQMFKLTACVSCSPFISRSVCQLY
jgi:hypothetical protein